MSLRVEAGFERLKDTLGEVLVKEVEFLPGMIVTVLGAKVTANTAHANITLSVFPETMEEEALRSLKRFEHEIKEGLSQRLRLRRMPRLHYTFDKTGAYVGEIDEAIKKMGQKNCPAPKLGAGQG